jgi:hypothetical protein
VISVELLRNKNQQTVECGHTRRTDSQAHNKVSTIKGNFFLSVVWLNWVCREEFINTITFNLDKWEGIQTAINSSDSV